MPKHAGISFPFTDSSILTVKSPRRFVTGGPWCVIIKGNHPNDRWALVALDWDKNRSLGIRWFDRSSGTPISSSYATWFIIPPFFHAPLISWLKSQQEYKQIACDVEDYLNEKLSGQKLQEKYQNQK